MITKLAAVNEMLEAILESPVNELGEDYEEAAIAAAKLDTVSRRVQAMGWHCNIDRGVSLAPTTSGIIPLSDDILKVDTTGTDRNRDVVRRAGKLYDRDNRTFVFKGPVKVDMVTFLDWDDLTFPLQSYILSVAGREFEQGHTSSPTLGRFTAERMMNAEIALHEDEAENEDANVIRDNRSAAAVVSRRRTLVI